MMRIALHVFFTFSMVFFAISPVVAAACSAKSGVATVPLLELYTSEGCSSCPPADQWLSGLKPDFKKFIPLAFHVDYWDYIGWKDRFSKAEYSDRQRKIAAFSGSGIVYTPQFVMNGRDFRGWDDARLAKFIESNQKIATRANLSLHAVIQNNGELHLMVSAQATQPVAKNADVLIALYENKLVSQVKAGENNGSILKHDYVVRALYGAYQMQPQHGFSKTVNLGSIGKKQDAQLNNMGAVIFVQNSQTGEILQSLALPFCDDL